MTRTAVDGQAMAETWDHSSHDEFLRYYAEKSARPEQLEHFRSIQRAILKVLKQRRGEDRAYDMLDIGCNAGTQCLIWSETGHRAHGLDVNEPLVELGRERAAAAGREIDFRVGSAVSLPWANQSMDICVALELLEHVADWQSCLSEFARVLRPGGALFLTTTNVLCPIQHEFKLPVYSWYPASLKQHCEKLSVTTRPELANHAKYPAVNWFSPYGMREYFSKLGFESFDRFDLVDTSNKGAAAKLVVSSIRALPPLRFLAHLCNPGITLLGLKTAN